MQLSRRGFLAALLAGAALVTAGVTGEAEAHPGALNEGVSVGGRLHTRCV